MSSAALLDTFGRVATDLRVSLDRPLQPAVLLLHARRGAGLAAQRRRADRRRGGPADHRRRRAARRRGGPLHRRRAAAAPWAARHRPAYGGAAPAAGDLDHHQRAGADPHREGAGRGRPRPGQRQPGHRARRGLPHDHPPRPARTTWSPGLEAAAAAGLGPVKVNAVLLRGVNDAQAPELLRWCLERGYQLRFIEQMPLDAQHGWSREGDGHRRRDLRLAAAPSSAWSRPRSRGAARPPSCSPSTAARTPSA